MSCVLWVRSLAFFVCVLAHSLARGPVWPSPPVGFHERKHAHTHPHTILSRALARSAFLCARAVVRSGRTASRATSARRPRTAWSRSTSSTSTAPGPTRRATSSSPTSTVRVVVVRSLFLCGFDQDKDIKDTSLRLVALRNDPNARANHRDDANANANANANAVSTTTRRRSFLSCEETRGLRDASLRTSTTTTPPSASLVPRGGGRRECVVASVCAPAVGWFVARGRARRIAPRGGGRGGLPFRGAEVRARARRRGPRLSSRLSHAARLSLSSASRLDRSIDRSIDDPYDISSCARSSLRFATSPPGGRVNDSNTPPLRAAGENMTITPTLWDDSAYDTDALVVSRTRLLVVVQTPPPLRMLNTSSRSHRSSVLLVGQTPPYSHTCRVISLIVAGTRRTTCRRPSSSASTSAASR